MTQMLFFRGHDNNAQGAVAKALQSCAPVLMENPSLVVQLETLTPMGQAWDADIRVFSLADGTGDIAHKSHHEKGDPSMAYNIDDVETAKRADPDDWKTLRHDHPEAAYRFGNSAKGGEVPDVPLQDIQIPDYEMTRASEPELKRILQELHEKRLKIIEEHKPELE